MDPAVALLKHQAHAEAGSAAPAAGGGLMQHNSVSAANAVFYGSSFASHQPRGLSTRPTAGGLTTGTILPGHVFAQQNVNPPPMPLGAVGGEIDCCSGFQLCSFSGPHGAFRL